MRLREALSELLNSFSHDFTLAEFVNATCFSRSRINSSCMVKC